MKSFYSIHNLIKVKVDNNRKDLQEGYSHYLRYFKTDKELNDNEYEVKDFFDFKLPQDSLNVSEFLRFKNGICFKSEKYAVEYDGNKITEYTTYANRATNLWIQVLLLKQSMSFIHSAGAEINGKGFLFPAFGGVGKTMLISHLRKLDNFKFFGDDFVIVNEKGEMLSYPSDFSIYDYHLNFFSEIKNTSHNNFLLRRKYFAWFFWIKKVINFISKRIHISSGPLLSGWNNSYVKVPASSLIPKSKIGYKVPLHATIFLERYSGDKIIVENMSHEELVKMITSILNIEFQHGISYFNALITATNIDSADFYKKQKEIIENALSKTKCYKLRLPQKLDPEDYFNNVDNFIKSI